MGQDASARGEGSPAHLLVDEGHVEVGVGAQDDGEGVHRRGRVVEALGSLDSRQVEGVEDVLRLKFHGP